MKNNYFVYILKMKDETLYCGITNNINKRMKQHSIGTASKYTRSRLPFILVFLAFIGSKSDALKIEIKIKKLKKEAKLELINSKLNALNYLTYISQF